MRLDLAKASYRFVPLVLSAYLLPESRRSRVSLQWNQVVQSRRPAFANCLLPLSRLHRTTLWLSETSALVLECASHDSQQRLESPSR